MNDRYPMVLFPAFKLQDTMQRCTLGTRRWIFLAEQVTKAKRAKEERAMAELRKMEMRSQICCVLMAILFGPCIKCVVRMRARRGKGAVNALDTIGLNAEEVLAAFDTAQEEKKEQERRARRAAAASAAAATGAATSTTVTVFGRPVALGPTEPAATPAPGSRGRGLVPFGKTGPNQGKAPAPSILAGNVSPASAMHAILASRAPISGSTPPKPAKDPSRPMYKGLAHASST